MTIAPSFDLQSEADLPELSFAAMRMAMLNEAQEHELPLLANSENEVTCGTPFGNIGIHALPEGLKIKVSAARSDWLFMLKESLVEHLAHFVPDAVDKLRWSDGEKVGSLPPNFQFAKVQSVEPLGTSFKRVRIKAVNLGSYDDESIHFRIILPSVGQDNVVWPQVGANGATIWPKGDLALHKPVYTARWIDQSDGLIDIDVFVHEGGRVSEWVNQVAVGDTTAIVGPGGGGIPQTKRINLYGDETAFPAIARILETLPKDSVGRVVLAASNGAACGYPIDAPAGIKVDWLSGDESLKLPDIALAEREKTPEHFLWFAAEKAAVQPVQKALKAAGMTSANSYVATYWSKS
ncbi:MAG: siderophore-interacting protein [Pseudomonadota bacterium]